MHTDGCVCYESPAPRYQCCPATCTNTEPLSQSSPIPFGRRGSTEGDGACLVMEDTVGGYREGREPRAAFPRYLLASRPCRMVQVTPRPRYGMTHERRVLQVDLLPELAGGAEGSDSRRGLEERRRRRQEWCLDNGFELVEADCRDTTQGTACCCCRRPRPGDGTGGYPLFFPRGS